MAMSTAKLTEIPLRTTLPLTSHYTPSSLHRRRFLFYPIPNPTLSLLRPFSSLRTTTGNPKTNDNRYPWDEESQQNPTQNPNPNNPIKSKPSSASWLNKWTPPTPNPPVESNSNRAEDRTEIRVFDGKGGGARLAGTNAIERIVLRLRNLGLGSDDEEEEDEGGEDLAMAITGEEKLGDLLARDWVRPDRMLGEDEEEEGESVLPWERVVVEREREGEEEVVKKRRAVVKAPSLAELTIEDAELRRLRREGMVIRERVSVAKAGVTGAVLEKIHWQWRKSELVRLKFHESLAHDMRTAHEIVEVCETIRRHGVYF